MTNWEGNGRSYIGNYTPDTDHEGWDALRIGGDFYSEGMSCDPILEHERRILLFQTAEMLYLRASAKGNRIADLNLGYVYSYDRCEGEYWDGWLAYEAQGNLREPEWHLQKAYEHYRKAAEAGIAEACYKLGDLLRDGRGCEADPSEAFAWFERSYTLGKGESPVIWGSAALRMGQAYEEGEGCEQSFDKACDWYLRATTGLEIAVRGGSDWYRGALRRAKRGLVRARQELSGLY